MDKEEHRNMDDKTKELMMIYKTVHRRDNIDILFVKYREDLLVLKIVFGLVSLVKVISTLVGYLMPKPFSKKNSSGTI